MMDVVIYGLINGLIYAFIAIGFTICYNVSRLPNFAHGSLYILAGLIAWTFTNILNLNYIISVIIAILLTALMGILMYQLLIIRIRGMEISEIIVTFAMAIFIMEILRFLGYAGPRFTLPIIYPGSITIYDVPIDFQRIMIGMVTGLLSLFLWYFAHHTKIGLALRAIAQDEQVAMMLGIDSDFTAALSLAFGSALAAVAAIFILPLGAITVETGYNVLIYAISVAILGGLGSVSGTFIASILLGYIQIITVKFFGPQYFIVVFLLAMFLILLVKPSGLLGKTKELEERV